MEESKLNEIGEWLNSQGYEIDLKDQLWMEDYIFGEHKIRDIAEMLVDYERRNDVSTSENSLHKHFVNASFLPKCTRVEVIDQSGRVYVNWKPTNKVQIQMQDDNKTLKVFIT